MMVPSRVVVTICPVVERVIWARKNQAAQANSSTRATLKLTSVEKWLSAYRARMERVNGMATVNAILCCLASPPLPSPKGWSGEDFQATITSHSTETSNQATPTLRAPIRLRVRAHKVSTLPTGDDMVSAIELLGVSRASAAVQTSSPHTTS